MCATGIKIPYFGKLLLETANAIEIFEMKKVSLPSKVLTVRRVWAICDFGSESGLLLLEQEVLLPL